jgi:hypothetical protein
MERHRAEPLDLTAAHSPPAAVGRTQAKAARGLAVWGEAAGGTTRTHRPLEPQRPRLLGRNRAWVGRDGKLAVGGFDTLAQGRERDRPAAERMQQYPVEPARPAIRHQQDCRAALPPRSRNTPPPGYKQRRGDDSTRAS